MEELPRAGRAPAVSRADLLRLLVTAIFWITFALTSPLVLAISAVLALVTSFDPERRIVHAFVCRASFNYLRLCPGWDVKVLHRERLPEGSAVLVANHQSMADIVAVMGLFHPFKFVSKASLFSVPLVGWVMSLARYVRVERGRPRSMQQMLDACRTWLARGMPVLLFPEGTYSPDGQMLPFRRGAFRLAIEQKVPIVPVVIRGTRDLVIEDGPWLNPRCRIRLTVLPPIEPAALGEDDQALAERVRRMMADAPEA